MAKRVLKMSVFDQEFQKNLASNLKQFKTSQKSYTNTQNFKKKTWNF